MSKNDQAGLTYAEAGVDIHKAAELVDQIKRVAQSTRTAGVLSGVGGFGSAFELPTGYQQPVLVSGTDGVGTKCLLANQMGVHQYLGIDLVAMCVNDIICLGAKPLYFLDYYATGQLDLQQSQVIIEGIAQGCLQAKMALIGGETAELPGMYEGHDYDLAGFCVGVVEKHRMLQATSVRAGDCVIALASSGAHANGYSLIRRVTADCDLNQQTLDGIALAELLLKPTKIYVTALLSLLASCEVHALAHITGGGLNENIPRVLPAGLAVQIDLQTWQWPSLFQWLQQQGGINTGEMRSTFNLGVGMVVVVPADQAQAALACLAASGESAWIMGSVVESAKSAVQWVGE